MPAVNIADLSSELRFHARLLHSTSLALQQEWLTKEYLKLTEDRSGAEITAQSFEGSSHSAQFRSATQDDRRSALQKAIEGVMSEVAGEVAHSLSRPFGIRWKTGYAPAQVLEGA